LVSFRYAEVHRLPARRLKLVANLRGQGGIHRTERSATCIADTVLSLVSFVYERLGSVGDQPGTLAVRQGPRLLVCKRDELALSLSRQVALLLLLIFFLGLAHRVDRQVNIDHESQHSHTDAPILQLRELCIEKEDIEKELVNHLEVADDLEFAGSLVLESHKFEGLGADHRHGHAKEHNPVNHGEAARIVHERLIQT